MRPLLRGLLARLLASCFQTRCAGCKAWGRQPVCTPCADSLPGFPDHTCPRCRGTQTPCPLCRPESPLAQVYAAAPYTGVMRRAIHGLKFDARQDLAFWLGAQMRAAIPPLAEDWILVPVPLSGDRLRERGYNQAEWLAQAIAGFPRRPRWLKRVRATTRQVGQGKAERWEGLQDAFEASTEAKGHRIMLVDDVLTTGATLSWAAHALRNAGAAEVRAVVAARAQLMKKTPPPG